ncbi:conserved hypothetical protein [Mesorhizobium escarrei]|uniref:Transposase IS111A/IS1328/IS1533 N-terminal domain-containing protein n=1 Tax=Mesorhizobium escarrei TaxID=666018 RepID=A0ABM9E7E4_9HYPH|nr:conserved hypothetical protein [Mesorhizobium escarrei]
MKETAVSIRREGKRVRRGKCASDPKIIANLIRKRAPAAKRVVFETGPLSCGSVIRCVPRKCRRSASMLAMPKAALYMAPNETDANDADGLAHLCRGGVLP